MRQASPSSKRNNRLSSRLFRWVKLALICFFLSSLCAVLAYRWLPVPITPLMLLRSGEALLAGHEYRIRHHWVSFAELTGPLPLAVVCSEDQNFPHHYGIDFSAIAQVLEADGPKGKRLRGASTISQQTAKNVFLWPQRSWLRKGLEVYFTLLIEILWSKQRILEVYLNSVEMGDGIYGADAAAHYWFDRQPKQLSTRQAAALAAILPNPRVYKAHPPSPYIKERISWITGQMKKYGTLRL